MARITRRQWRWAQIKDPPVTHLKPKPKPKPESKPKPKPRNQMTDLPKRCRSQSLSLSLSLSLILSLSLGFILTCTLSLSRTQDPLAFISQLALFRDVPVKHLEEMAWNMTMKQPPLNHLVAHAGEESAEVYLVKAGQLKLQVDLHMRFQARGSAMQPKPRERSMRKKTKILALIGPGDVIDDCEFGEHGKQYNMADVVADSTDVQIYTLPRPIFQRDIQVQRNLALMNKGRSALRHEGRSALRHEQGHTEAFDAMMPKEKKAKQPRKGPLEASRNAPAAALLAHDTNPGHEGKGGDSRFLPPLSVSPKRVRHLWEEPPHLR